jgi:hypothetical protein
MKWWHIVLWIAGIAVAVVAAATLYTRLSASSSGGGLASFFGFRKSASGVGAGIDGGASGGVGVGLGEGA